MSDRYAASYYEQLHPAQAQAQAAMSHYAPPGYRNAPYAPVGSGPYNSSPYGYGYAAGGSASYMPNYYRYAPYASPHYSQPPHSHPHSHHQQPSHHHPGMFTPAGQQLIPSSVLHYPPRSHPQPQQQQHPHHLQQSLPHHAYQQPASNSSYEQPPPALYSASSYGQSRGFTAYQSSSTHYAPPGRSTTPAPNRTVLPPNYLEPMRNSFTDQQQQQQQQLPKVEETLPELKLEHEAEAASPTQRLTTSPPLISATGTDSGISNCSTRARSDSSQSTPVYSGEYPVNMSVESASCVSYHCPADGRDYDEEQQQQQQQQHQQQQQQHQPQQQQETEEPKPGSVSSSSDDISATAATSTSPTSSVNDIDKAAATATAEAAAAAAATTIEAETTTATDEAQSEVQASSTATSHNWSPTPRRPRTPPAPQNSPVGFGLSASSAPHTVPPALAPLLQLQQQQQLQQQHHHHQPQQQHLSGNSKRHAKNRHSSSSNNNNNSNNSGNNRIIECDLIPSKKSKRKSSKKEADAEHVDATESTVREQIRDIKPLPGFLQAFGSTEIGRFSERFLQTPESLVERLVEEYAHSNGGYATSNGYYDAPMNGAAATGVGVGGMHGYWPYEEQHNMAYQQSQHLARNRMRGQGYPYPDYAAYERYGYAAYSANRSRYGEIRCNGY
ncbi:hypothetical protein KR215_011566 [Drosophila sulfurigaster]|nr:hypothetical protein KR215_011566 [Drosophila sulfurigaster]